jgi:hypothetical protein
MKSQKRRSKYQTLPDDEKKKRVSPLVLICVGFGALMLYGAWNSIKFLYKNPETDYFMDME